MVTGNSLSGDISSLKVVDNKLRILHLEDVNSDALLISQAIKRGNIDFEILVVDTKDKFIKALREFSPDIILADHSLPSFNSVDALELFLETGIKVPFILVTATISEEFAVSIIMKGANDYILKDRLNRLPIAILNSLEKFRLKKEREFFVAELVKKEKRYRAIVEHSGDVVVILNKEGKPTFVSPSVRGVLGYTEEEVKQMDLFTIAHPSDISLLANTMKDVLANPGIAIKGHTGRMLHKDGSWRWIEATVINLLHDPAVNGIVDNFRDITKRKLAEEEIVKNEHKFRTLIENSADGMAILSADGKPKYVSPSVRNVLGYAAEEAMQLDLFTLAHPDDISILVGMMQEAMATPGVAVNGSSTRMKHKNGSWRWIEGTITNLLHDPAVNGIVDNFRDITERKLAELAMKESEEKYRSFFKNSMDGILLTVTDGKILEANPAACTMFGMSEIEICNAGRFGLVDNTDPRVAAGIKERQSIGKAKVELTLIRKNGDRFPGELSSVVYKNALNEKRTLLIVRDISERTLAEKKIVHLNRLYSFISQINQSIVSAGDEQTVFKEACRIAIEIGKFKAAWIEMTAVDNKNLHPIEGFGMLPEDLSNFTKISLEKNGLHEYVLQSGTYYVCNNINQDDILEHWKPLAAEKGYASCIILPIKKYDNAIGTFTLYSSELNFFTVEEIQLLEEATSDISFALDIFEKQKLKVKADVEIKHKELRLNQAQAIAHLGSWEVDFSTGILTYSEEALRIYGISKDDGPHSFDSWISLIHPNDLQHVLDANKEVKASSPNSSFAHRILRKDGSVRHGFSQAQYEFNNEGKLACVYGVTHDVTEIKEGENELHKLQSNLQAIFENTSEAFILTDIFGNIKLFNTAAKDFILLNTAKVIVVGRSIFDYLKEAGKEKYKKFIEKVSSGETVRYDHFYEGKDGRIRWFDFRINPVYNSGSIDGICITVGDITYRKKTEDSLKKSETSYRQIAETAQEGIWVLNQDNETVFVNKKMCDIVGYSQEEMKGKPDHFLIDKEKKITVLERIERRKQGVNEIYESELLTKSGEHIWANVSANPIFDDDGIYKGALAMITDITAPKNQEKQIRKNAEEREVLIRELSKSLNDLKEFTYITSHNFRAPLSNLVGLLSLIDYSTLTKMNREIIEMFKTSTNQLNKTIQDLIKILIIRNNVNVNITQNNIAMVLNKVQNFLVFEINESKCIIKTDLKVPHVSFNLFYLESILINLVSNAIKYRSQNRVLQLDISTTINSEGKVILTVKDNGVGIDLDRNRDNIFGLYQRFHSNTDGEGLGLFIVKSQITALGGSIDVESELDKGTSFIITFKDKIQGSS